MRILSRHAAGAVVLVAMASTAMPALAEDGAIEPGNLVVANFQAFPGFGDFVGTVIQFDLSGRGLGNIRTIKSEMGDPDADLFDGDPLPGIPWGPGGMAIGGPNRDLYVASILRGTITRFDHRDGSAGESVQVVPIPGTDALFFGLRGMVWGPNGNLFVSVCGADGNTFGAVDAVFELDRRSLGKVREIRQAGMPTIDCFGGIAFGPDDLLYVSGIFSGNVVAFDLSTAESVGGDPTVVEVATVRDIFMLEPGESAFDTLAALTARCSFRWAKAGSRRSMHGSASWRRARPRRPGQLPQASPPASGWGSTAISMSAILQRARYLSSTRKADGWSARSRTAAKVSRRSTRASSSSTPRPSSNTNGLGV